MAEKECPKFAGLFTTKFIKSHVKTTREIKSDAQRVNSHTTPNYEKTFDAPNQRPYHFQTVKLLFLVKQKKKEGEGLAEKDLQH